MKRLCILVISVAVWFALPAVICAQGWPQSGAVSILLGPASLTPGPISGRCDAAGSLAGLPEVYVGRLEHGQGSTWALQRTDRKGTAPWPLKGYWLGATQDLGPAAGLGLLAAGGIFIPQPSAGNWYQIPTGTVDFEVPSYDWWMAEGLVRSPLNWPLVLLGGVRWDHTSTRVNFADNTSDDYILNVYLPLIGLQLNQAFSGGSCLFRFVGTPVVLGRLKYHFWDPPRLYTEFGDFEVKGGSFVEALIDYRVKVTSELSLGGFVKWNALRINTAERSLSGSTIKQVSWEVDIRSWTFGGVASLALSSPF